VVAEAARLLRGSGLLLGGGADRQTTRRLRSYARA
jgi:hypothetical protein